MPDAVLVERPRPQVAVIRLNRPEKLNAMNIDLVDGIHDALDEVDADNDIRVVILTGAGRGFCSGADLTGFGEVPGTDDLGPVPTMFRHQQRIVRLIPRMRALRKPIIEARAAGYPPLEPGGRINILILGGSLGARLLSETVPAEPACRRDTHRTQSASASSIERSPTKHGEHGS